MNDQFIMTVICAECDERFSHHNPNSPLLEEEEMFFAVEFNFKEGRIEFICPKCNKLNAMEFISHGNISRYAKLPNIRAGRG